MRNKDIYTLHSLFENSGYEQKWVSLNDIAAGVGSRPYDVLAWLLNLELEGMVTRRKTDIEWKTSQWRIKREGLRVAEAMKIFG